MSDAGRRPGCPALRRILEEVADDTRNLPANGPASPILIGILGSFLIVAALVWAMQHYTQPPPLGEDRVALRKKALAELRAAEASELDSYGWVDQGKGVVRLPISEAMKLTLREWQNPASRPVQPDCPRGKGHRGSASGSGEAQPVRVGRRWLHERDSSPSQPTPADTGRSGPGHLLRRHEIDASCRLPLVVLFLSAAAERTAWVSVKVPATGSYSRDSVDTH